MTTLYKLTDGKGQTYNGTKWKLNKPIKVEKPHPVLCGDGVLHAYRNLNLGLILNQGGFDNPRIYEAQGEVVVEDWGKCGVFELTLTKRLVKPAWYASEATRKKVYVAFSISCAESVLANFEKMYPEDKRPREAIEAAKAYLAKPSSNAANSAANSANYAAYSAANCAANCAAYNSANYSANYAAYNSANYAAYGAANSAASAANCAAYNSANYAAYSAANYAAYSAANAPDFGAPADQAVETVTKCS